MLFYLIICIIFAFDAKISEFIEEEGAFIRRGPLLEWPQVT